MENLATVTITTICSDAFIFLKLFLDYIFFFIFVFRIAKLFNHNELEAVKDRKDKFKR